MSLIDRVKKIITTPKTEWVVIDGETASPSSLAKGYILPLAIAGAVASFVGWSFIGSSFLGVKVYGMNYGINYAVLSLASAIVSFFIATYVVDALAPTFKSEKNLAKSAQIVAYSSTPSLVGALLAIIPSLSLLGVLFGFYGLYLIYIGLPLLKKTPEDQKLPYIVVAIIVCIVVGMVVGAVLTAVLAPVFGISRMGFGL